MSANSVAHQGAEVSLKSGTLGWVSVAALGIAIAVSGNFSGWNFGLGLGGLGGMLLAALCMALFYFGLTQCVAEMASSLHDEAGFDGYVRRLLGGPAGFVCGMAVALAVAVAVGLILTFIDAYASAALGIGGWPVRLGVLAVVLALQFRGAGEAVGLTMIVGAIALLVLLGYCLFIAPSFEIAHWRHVGDAQATQQPAGWAAYFPNGLSGTLQCVPYALFMFLGVEQATLAGPEMRDMRRGLPKALIAAISVSVLISLSVLVLSTGAAGVPQLAPSEDPLLTVLSQHAADRAGTQLLVQVVGIGALCALLSTFFSLVYASSRQVYHLAASDDLPRMLARVNRRGAPTAALLAVALLGIAASAFPADAVIVVVIFLISMAYLHMIAAFIRMRSRRAPQAAGYQAIGGVPLALLTGAIALLIAGSCVYLQAQVLGLAALALALLYGWAGLRQAR